MYLGRVVELAECDELYGNPLHPYTRALLEAVPVPIRRSSGRAGTIVKGEVPSPMNPPSRMRVPSALFAGGRGVPKAVPELREVKPATGWPARRFERTPA